MINAAELLELLRAEDLQEPLNLEALGQYEASVREDVAKTLCENLQKLAEELPDAADREPMLMVMVARLFMDNLAYQATNLAAASPEAGPSIILP
jgi:hypothetical protein